MRHPSRDVIFSGQNLAKKCPKLSRHMTSLQPLETSTFSITWCDHFWPNLWLEVAEVFHISNSGTEKEPKPKLLSPDIFRWGRGLPREGVGTKKFGMSLETREIEFGWDIPGFCRRRSKSLRKKFVFNFGPLTFTTLWTPLWGERCLQNPGKLSQLKGGGGGQFSSPNNIGDGCWLPIVLVFLRKKHQNSQNGRKFMNFSCWPFLWFGLPGPLLKMISE